METSQARSIWCYYAYMCFSGFAFRTCIGNRPPRGRVHLRLTEQLNHSWAAYIPRRVLPCIGTGTISETLAGAPETRGWWPTSLWQLGGTVFLWGGHMPPMPPSLAPPVVGGVVMGTQRDGTDLRTLEVSLVIQVAGDEMPAPLIKREMWQFRQLERLLLVV